MKRVTLFAVAMLFSLTACGKTLDGTYADASGMVQYKFSGHKVTMKTMGVESELDYSIDGDDIKIAVGAARI